MNETDKEFDKFKAEFEARQDQTVVFAAPEEVLDAIDPGVVHHGATSVRVNADQLEELRKTVYPADRAGAVSLLVAALAGFAPAEERSHWEEACELESPQPDDPPLSEKGNLTISAEWLPAEKLTLPLSGSQWEAVVYVWIRNGRGSVGWFLILQLNRVLNRDQ